jgi:hypothetical protein
MHKISVVVAGVFIDEGAEALAGCTQKKTFCQNGAAKNFAEQVFWQEIHGFVLKQIF